MAQPKIVEVDYFVLRDKLKVAVAAGGRIEKTDKDRWAEYVKAHQINVITMQAWAKVKFMSGKSKMAIIDHGAGWDGFYAYSEVDEAALKWEPGIEVDGSGGGGTGGGGTEPDGSGAGGTGGDGTA